MPLDLSNTFVLFEYFSLFNFFRHNEDEIDFAKTIVAKVVRYTCFKFHFKLEIKNGLIFLRESIYILCVFYLFGSRESR